MKQAIASAILCLALCASALAEDKAVIRIMLSSGSTAQSGQVLEVLRNKCDKVNLTISQEKADYFLEASNVPPDVRYVLFNREGDAVFLAAPRHADNATKDVCQFLGRLK
jgi:hypothetical protein